MKYVYDPATGMAREILNTKSQMEEEDGKTKKDEDEEDEDEKVY